jgi:superfamily I DNA/RNA helicase
VVAKAKTKTAIRHIEVVEPTPLLEQIASTTALTPVSAPAPVELLSPEQLAIATEVRVGKGNILVVARAGTGKTYLLRKCVPLMRGSIAVCAYNRKIAKEMLKKLGDDGWLRSWQQMIKNLPGCDVNTFHAFGFMIVRNVLKGIRLEGYEQARGNTKPAQAGFIKMRLIAERLEIPEPLYNVVRKAVEFGQNRGIGILTKLNDAKAWLALADHYALASELPEDGSVLAQMMGCDTADWRDGLLKLCLGYAIKAIKMSVDMATEKFTRERTTGYGDKRKVVGIDHFTGVLTMNEMLYLPLVLDMPIPQYDWVLVDEAQDSNPLRREMARRMLKSKLVERMRTMGVDAFEVAKRMGFTTPRGEPTEEGVETVQDWMVSRTKESIGRNLYKLCTVLKCKGEVIIGSMGRMMWVGDDRQAIYGFSGADNDALEQIGEQFECTQFPMTVTFRCCKAVVALVQGIVPDYKAANDNPLGEAKTISEADFHKLELITHREAHQTGDAIICRNTAPLIALAYKLIARGVACHVEGREIGRNLIDLIERFRSVKTLLTLRDKIVEYRDKEIAILMGKDQEAQADILNDKAETVLAMIAGMPQGSRVDDLVAKINGLFKDMDDGLPAPTVTLLTGHKAKGLEFTRVFAWGVRAFIPSKFAKKEWQLKQEENLEYVIYTRAIMSLINVTVAIDSPVRLAA